MTALNGSFAILTGAAQGLGLAIAHAYARQGMKLALMDVQADKLNALADELEARGRDACPIPVSILSRRRRHASGGRSGARGPSAKPRRARP